MRITDTLSFKADDIAVLKNFITYKIYKHGYNNDIKDKCKKCIDQCDQLISSVNELLLQLDSNYLINNK